GDLGAVRAVQVGELRAEGFQVVVGDTSGDDHVDLADPACGEVLAEHLRGLAAVSVVGQVALVGGADVERGQRRRERDEHGSDRDQVEDGTAHHAVGQPRPAAYPVVDVRAGAAP